MRFLTQVVAPFKALYKGVQKIFLPKSSQTAEIIEMQEKILKDFNGLQGLINSHEIWENGYRKMSGNPKWMANNDFLIPDSVLDGKIQFTDVQLNQGSARMNINALLPIINKLNPFMYETTMLKTKGSIVRVSDINIVNNNINITGSVFIPKTSL